MAERDQVGGPLGGHDAGDLGDGAHVALLACAGRAPAPASAASSAPGPSATASRAVAGLAETSTIRARPSASRWVRPAHRLQQPGHQLDHVAGPVAAVELGGDDLVPAVAHRAVGAGQAEHEDAVDQAGQGPRLQGREADRLVADQVEDHREAVDPLSNSGLDRLGRDVAAGEAGAAGGDDGVDLARASSSALIRGADRLDVVGARWPCRRARGRRR